jgi:hypothetical protein
MFASGSRNLQFWWGWRTRLGTMKDAAVHALVVSPYLVWRTFDDADSIILIVKPAKQRSALYLQSVPLVLWMEVERMALALLTVSGVLLQISR